MKNNHNNVLYYHDHLQNFKKWFIISKIIILIKLSWSILLFNKTSQIVYFNCFVSVFRVLISIK